MGKFRKPIKKALDKYFFDHLTLSETEANYFASKIKKLPQKRSLKRLAFIIPAVAAGLVLLISFMLLKPFINGTENVSATIEKKATEEFGQPVFIPEFKDYPITFATISHPPFSNEPVDLTISYGKSKGELEPAFSKEANRQKWEKEQGATLLYGPYQEQRAFSIQYRPGRVEFDWDDIKEREINGVPILYEHIKRDAELVIVNINANGRTYLIDFIITDNFTLADSEKVLEDITKQMKKFSS
ncbi:hypothetical protein KDN24_15560 [Bacillus sp. Bva_UNVM-123]|uniref:hypothetical protein n=1 Tax=Bacillus sp. Bva_UNVM-123 TaxID=2829798 RepID=UPI00391F53B0